MMVLENADSENIKIVYLAGNIEISTVNELQNEMEKIISEMNDNCKKMIFNFEKTEYMDIYGIEILVKLQERVQEEEIQLKLSNLREDIYKMIEKLKTKKYFKIFRDEEAAVNSYW